MQTLEKIFKFKTHVHGMSLNNIMRVFIRINSEHYKNLDKLFAEGEYIYVVVEGGDNFSMTFHAKIQRINKDKKINRRYRIEIPVSYRPAIKDWMFEKESLTVSILPAYPK